MLAASNEVAPARTASPDSLAELFGLEADERV
jgi:hypothetical protein